MGVHANGLQSAIDKDKLHFEKPQPHPHAKHSIVDGVKELIHEMVEPPHDSAAPHANGLQSAKGMK
jgi:hypothetical protein